MIDVELKLRETKGNKMITTKGHRRGGIRAIDHHFVTLKHQNSNYQILHRVRFGMKKTFLVTRYPIRERGILTHLETEFQNTKMIPKEIFQAFGAQKENIVKNQEIRGSFSNCKKFF